MRVEELKLPETATRHDLLNGQEPAVTPVREAAEVAIEDALAESIAAVGPLDIIQLARRRHAMTMEMPWLVRGVGERFDELFVEYALQQPVADSAWNDGMMMAGYLDGRGLLSDLMRVRMLRGRLCAGGSPLGMARFRSTRGLAIGMRLPRLGVRIFELGFGPRHS